MDNPVFKLEGVVHERSAETLQDFEGPLDLILFLLSKNKIEIQDIPIALILDQYLAYLEQRKQLDLEVASEFITMAAHLMYIKTRMLLSLEDEQAQSEMDELIASLKERQQKDTYLRIKTLTETLGPMGEFGRSIMTRQPEPMQRGKIYEYSHEKADLVLAMQTIMERGEKLAAPPSAALSEIVRREPYPVKGKAEEILHRLKEFGMTRFKLLFRGSRSRSEIVATFIAVLELCREKVIHLAGSDTDCTVECGDVLDTEDFLVSNLLLPIGSLVYLLFCVSKWGWGFDKYIAEVNKGTGIRLSPKLKPYFQWILPILILIILVQGLI